MASGKYLLVCGILLGGAIARLEAQPTVNPPSLPANDGISGWAVDRGPTPNPVAPVLTPTQNQTKPKPYPWTQWRLFSKPPNTTQTPQSGFSPAKPVETPVGNQVAQPRPLPMAPQLVPIVYKNSPNRVVTPAPTNTSDVVTVAPPLKGGSPSKTGVENQLPMLQPVPMTNPITKEQLTTPVLAPSPISKAHFSGLVQVGYQNEEQQASTQTEKDQPILKGVPLPPLGTILPEESHLPPVASSGGGEQFGSAGAVPANWTTSTGPSQFGTQRINPSGIVLTQPSPLPSKVLAASAVQTVDNKTVVVATTSALEGFPPTGPSYSPSLPAVQTTGQSILPDQIGWVDPTRSHYYAKGEYLLWWTKGDPVPPLVTTGPALFTPGGAPDGATLNRSDTRVLFGGDSLSQGARSGVRLTAGWWYDWDCAEGIELTGFILPQQSRNFYANSTQYPQLSRPFTDQVTGMQSAQDTTFPGIAVGSIQVHAPSQFWGLEANLRCKLCCDENCWGSYRVDAIAGPRYLNLGESISITENSYFSGNPNNGPFQNRFDVVNDSFSTRNQFIGGQIGLDGQYNYERWSLDVRAKVGLGDTIQSLVVQGSQSLPDQFGNRTGGLLALQSNIGRYGKDTFSVVPEVGVNLGYQFTDHIRATFGYNFLAWTNVLRPGEQINTTLDSSLIPQFPTQPKGSGLEPAIPFKESTFWAQGLTIGLEFRY